jgi:cytochrome c peroxidase
MSTLVKKLILLCGIALVLISSCKKDKNDTPPIVDCNPKPYDIEWPFYFPAPLLPKDNPLTEAGVRLGHHLFYEKRLSGNNTMSCASCHLQEANFSEFQQFSVGIDGIAGNRNAMPIMNLAWQEFFFWDGRSNSLEEQALLPVEDPIEMHETWPNALEKILDDPMYVQMFKDAFCDVKVTKYHAAKALAQFERVLVSANSKFDRVRFLQTESFTPLEAHGYSMFMSEEGDCFHCHGDLSTGNLFGAWGQLQFANNGLDSVLTPNTGLEVVTGRASDRGRFKIASVRNVEFSFPYMHDGRFWTLEEVIEHYNMGGHITETIDPGMEFAGIGHNWTPFQKNALIAFIKTLSDIEFLENPKFADPHKN